MQPTRWSGTTFVVLLALAFAVLAQPASAFGARGDALREVPGALDRAEQPRAQSRSTAVTAAAIGSPRGFPAVHLSPGTIAGYIPLDLFGGTLVTPIGDEDLVTFNVPSFAYNGLTFDAVTVDSNGYAIPGSDDSRENNNCCDISLGPSRPNGILAPFWTDLDGTGAQGVLLNVLTDGVGVWIVIEWRVNDFSTLNRRTFQLWLGTGGTQDIAYSYDFSTFGTSPAAQDYIVAAENLDGLAFDSLPFNTLPTTDQYVTSGAVTLNEIPVANVDSYSTAEDTELTVAAPGVLANDTDGEADPLIAELVTGPANGELTFAADGSFSYAPDADFNGNDSFTYRVDDGYDVSPEATVTLQVTPVNDAPTVTVAAGGSCGGDDRSGTINLAVADPDSSAGSLTLTAVSSNTAVVANSGLSFGGSGAARTLTATALSGRTGIAVITVTVSDGTRTRSVAVTLRAGGNGNDALAGTSGADILLGQNGNDTLSGLAGIDLLCGARGIDRLTGGADADRFSGGPGTDTATDLTAAQGDTQDGTIP